MKDTKLSHFELDVPENLIAKKPATFRDESRMLVLHKKTGEIEHRQFKDILEHFQKDGLPCSHVWQQGEDGSSD